MALYAFVYQSVSLENNDEVMAGQEMFVCLFGHIFRDNNTISCTVCYNQPTCLGDYESEPVSTFSWKQGNIVTCCPVFLLRDRLNL